MSFFKELKRRNVFKVAIAYVVVAWLVMQFADVVLNNIQAPGWVFQAIMLVLGIGFMLTLFFAWAFEMTPEGIKREHEVDRSQSITQQTGRMLDFTIIAVLVLALGYFVAEKFLLKGSEPFSQDLTQQAQFTETEKRALTPGFQTIAVLPFVDMSPKGDNEYFSDGLTEELLNILAKIKELQVAGRTSSFAFKGKSEDLRSIGEKLGVNTILEGSVRKDEAGERVRITAQLVSVENGFHLWSETYDRELKDIFAIQDEIAHQVAAALRITLLGEDEARLNSRAVTGLNAYELYLRGLKNFNDYSYASLRQAEQDFLQSMEQDPDYVPSQLGLIQTLHESFFTGAMTRKEYTDRSQPMLTQILERDPGNAKAHVLSAQLVSASVDAEFRRKELNLALDADPRNVEALSEMGRFIFDLGDTQTGMEYLAEAGRIDPYSVSVLWDLCITNAFMLKPDEADRFCGRIGEIQPDNPMRYYGPAMAQSFTGNLAQSLVLNQKSIELDPDDYELPARMAMHWVSLGDIGQAELWLQKAEEIGAGQPVPIMARIMLYQYREQYGMAGDVARRALEKKLDNRQRSDAAFRDAYIKSLVDKGNINEAIEYFREKQPGAFEVPPDFSLSIPYGAGDLFTTAKLMMIQDPKSEQAEEMLKAAEAKWALRDDAWFPWAHALNRASVAVLRGNKDEALEHLFDAYEKNYRVNWRRGLTSGIWYRELQDEPEFKRLIAKYEADMDRQREVAYELLGIRP